MEEYILRAHDYILARQTSWAENRGISLIGSRGQEVKELIPRNLT